LPKSSWIEISRGCDQAFQIVPWSVLERSEAYILFVPGLTLEQFLRVGHKCTMDERKTNMVLEYVDLADARADRSPAAIIIITEPARVADLRGVRRNRSDQVTEFKDDIPQLRGGVFKIMVQLGSW